MVYSGLNVIFSRKYTVFLSMFQKVLFYKLSRHKIDVKENTTLQHDVNKNEEIKQLHSGKHANSTNSVRNPPYLSLSCEHNIETYGRVR